MNIVLTGANRGIGFELLKLFLKYDKYNVIAISRSTNNIEKLQAKTSKLKIIKFDLGKIESIKEKLIPEIEAKFETIEILINNAAILDNSILENKTEENIIKEININTIAPVFLIKYLSKLLKNGIPGHVVNIGSMAGFQSSLRYSGLSTYGASKAALASFSESMAVEYQGSIIVNCLALGAVNTDMFKNTFSRQTSQSPEEMANYIKDFSLNGWKYYNGKVLPVAKSNP